MENRLTILPDDEKILNTQRIVIHKLLKSKNKSTKATKGKIEAAIQQVDELELTLGNYKGCYLREINVDEEKCYLVYDTDEGKETGYKGETGLINNDYIILYRALNNYGLITENMV